MHFVQLVQDEIWFSRAALGDIPGLTAEFVDERKERSEPLKGMWKDVERRSGLSTINVCVASFSQIRDSISQWRAYASHGGFCVGFHGKRLADLVRAHGFYLARCIYDPVRQQKLAHALVEEVLEENIERHPNPGDLPEGGNLRAYLNRYAPIMKHDSFGKESEWRIISSPQPCTGARFDFREGTSMLIPFYRFPLDSEHDAMPLKEVVVGPTPDPERSLASVRSLLIKQGLKDVEVTPSEVPYRNW